MGGGGSYYDRDVTDRGRVRGSGYSDLAERAFQRHEMDAACSPEDRQLACAAASAIVLGFDVTGSMGSLPKIIYDKIPMIAGQLVMYDIVKDPQVSLAAIGDATCDRAPLQIGDFVPIKKLDGWLKRLYLEGGGGPSVEESYELAAWFYAYRCDLSQAANKILIITGDEDFYSALPAGRLKALFGGRSREGTRAAAVFRDLLKKFDGKVFLIHRHYGSGFSDDDSRIIRHWKKVLGASRVLQLGTDKAVGDVILGVIALMIGGQTLDGYCESMKERRNLDTGKAEPQSPQRIREVRKALEPLTKLEGYALPPNPAPEKRKKATGKRTGQKQTAAKPAAKKTAGVKSSTKCPTKRAAERKSVRKKPAGLTAGPKRKTP